MHYQKRAGFTYFFFFLEHIRQLDEFIDGFDLSAEGVKVGATTTAISFQDQTEP